jgi:hypothetical protein
MTFVLSSQNVFDYLIEHGLCTQEDKANNKIERKAAKNFNLLLTLADGRKLLVKQEPRNREGKTGGEFLREWRVQELLQKFPELSQMRGLLPEAIHFNAEDSIIVFNYLDNYQDVMAFYFKDNIFPTQIATSIGKTLATIHRLTINRKDIEEFFSPQQENEPQTQENESPSSEENLGKDLERITPEIFGLLPADGLKFFSLYQRYDSLGQAIAEVGNSMTPCCLTHHDLKLNNILLSHDWEQAEISRMVRFIDCERCMWGEPAFDLGTLISSYLHIWLNSLVASKTMSIDESLRMATTPLETVQPSMIALVRAYFEEFPEILEHRPDFLPQAMQFAGWMLISFIQATLQYQKSFGNTGICMLQVAKTLLCRPEASIATIFGMQASELISTTLSPV